MSLNLKKTVNIDIKKGGTGESMYLFVSKI